MCGSELNVKGGMVSVIKNYLNYSEWGEYKIIYIPTHVEKNKVIVMIYFIYALLKILFYIIFRKIDIAYLHTAERGSFYRKAILVRIFNFFGIQTVMHHHAAEFEEFYESLSEKNKSFVNNTLELVTLNIVLSNRLIPMIKNKAEKANVKVLYNAVTTFENNPYNKKARHILFLGRLGQRKGTYDFLEAIKQINGELHDDIKIYLCGDGEIEKVKAKISELELENRIDYIGWIDDSIKEKFLSETMLNVLPSYNEGLPMTILETMAHGIPNISTYVASIPEVIRDGENGFLIQPGDVEKMTETILQICNNEGIRDRISNQSWLEIKSKFSIDKHIAQLKEYLDML